MLHQVCDIHAFVGVYNKTFNLLDEHITGVIRAALSLRCGSSMARFRKCLREEIESRFEICDGVPPLASRAYRRMVVQLFAANGNAVVERRTLLALCPKMESGDRGGCNSTGVVPWPVLTHQSFWNMSLMAWWSP